MPIPGTGVVGVMTMQRCSYRCGRTAGQILERADAHREARIGRALMSHSLGRCGGQMRRVIARFGPTDEYRSFTAIRTRSINPMPRYTAHFARASFCCTTGILEGMYKAFCNLGSRLFTRRRWSMVWVSGHSSATQHGWGKLTSLD